MKRTSLLKQVLNPETKGIPWIYLTRHLLEYIYFLLCKLERLRAADTLVNIEKTQQLIKIHAP
jgi:hypothetical protein